MVLVSYSGREINAKLVYYGPGLSGKTTNLECIYGSIPQTQRGKMVSMKTQTERTLFFDFLPVNLGELSGFKTRFLLYTVPGQVYYNATRKLVLKGVDAVVFVADSMRGKMNENVESLENLRENLREHGLNLGLLPWVIQYNKRDLPDVYSIEELEEVLNPDHVPHYQAVARSGQGVAETFKGVSRLLLQKVARDVGVSVVPNAAAPAGPDSGAAFGAEHEMPQATVHPYGEPQMERAPIASSPVAPESAPAAREPSVPAPAFRAAAEPRTAPAPATSSERVRADGEPGTKGDQPERPEMEEDEEWRRVTVGERLRRWLSRPGAHLDQETPASEEHVTPGRPDEQGMADRVEPSVPATARRPESLPKSEPMSGSRQAGGREEKPSPAATAPERPTAGEAAGSSARHFGEPTSVFSPTFAPNPSASSGPAESMRTREPAAMSSPGPDRTAAEFRRRRRTTAERQAKPREIIVPLILEGRDLSRGVVVRFAIQFASHEEGGLEENEAG